MDKDNRKYRFCFIDYMWYVAEKWSEREHNNILRRFVPPYQKFMVWNVIFNVLSALPIDATFFFTQFTAILNVVFVKNSLRKKSKTTRIIGGKFRFYLVIE